MKGGLSKSEKIDEGFKMEKKEACLVFLEMEYRETHNSCLSLFSLFVKHLRVLF
jgi:hypothetical protein